jgi:hypothetical protein
MRKMMARQAIGAIVALPIVILANTAEAWANISGQKIDPIKKVSGFGDRLDLEIPTTTSTTAISIEESEDWDEPDFSANLDTEIAKFMTVGVPAIAEDIQTIIDEPLPILYLSAARGQSTRECRVSGICE